MKSMMKKVLKIPLKLGQFPDFWYCLKIGKFEEKNVITSLE